MALSVKELTLRILDLEICYVDTAARQGRISWAGRFWCCFTAGAPTKNPWDRLSNT